MGDRPYQPDPFLQPLLLNHAAQQGCLGAIAACSSQVHQAQQHKDL